jgi:cytochrome b involved in lipid metabolism
MKKNLGIIIAIIIVAILALVWWTAKKPVSVTPNQTVNTTTSTNTSATTEKKAGFTMADVAAHKTAGDCYVAVGNKVYNLTAWISQHPGGEQAILGLCGTDGTQAFTQQHGSNEKAQSVLSSFLIGNLI